MSSSSSSPSSPSSAIDQENQSIAEQILALAQNAQQSQQRLSRHGSGKLTQSIGTHRSFNNGQTNSGRSDSDTPHQLGDSSKNASPKPSFVFPADNSESLNNSRPQSFRNIQPMQPLCHLVPISQQEQSPTAKQNPDGTPINSSSLGNPSPENSRTASFRLQPQGQFQPQQPPHNAMPFSSSMMGSPMQSIGNSRTTSFRMPQQQNNTSQNITPVPVVPIYLEVLNVTNVDLPAVPQIIPIQRVNFVIDDKNTMNTGSEKNNFNGALSPTKNGDINNTIHQQSCNHTPYTKKNDSFLVDTSMRTTSPPKPRVLTASTLAAARSIADREFFYKTPEEVKNGVLIAHKGSPKQSSETSTDQDDDKKKKLGRARRSLDKCRHCRKYKSKEQSFEEHMKECSAAPDLSGRRCKYCNDLIPIAMSYAEHNGRCQSNKLKYTGESDSGAVTEKQVDADDLQSVAEPTDQLE